MEKIIVRVYALVFNEKDEILTLKENYKGFEMLKFPGGGLEIGEGTIDCLKREFDEEFENVEIIKLSHFYTTDFFQASAFNSKDQIISVYYNVIIKKPSVLKLKPLKSKTEDGPYQLLWQKLNNDLEKVLTFPIDKLVLQKIISLKDV